MITSVAASRARTARRSCLTTWHSTLNSCFQMLVKLAILNDRFWPWKESIVLKTLQFLNYCMSRINRKKTATISTTNIPRNQISSLCDVSGRNFVSSKEIVIHTTVWLCRVLKCNTWILIQVKKALTCLYVPHLACTLPQILRPNCNWMLYKAILHQPALCTVL